jgi:hypothetical protein
VTVPPSNVWNFDTVTLSPSLLPTLLAAVCSLSLGLGITSLLYHHPCDSAPEPSPPMPLDSAFLGNLRDDRDSNKLRKHPRSKSSTRWVKPRKNLQGQRVAANNDDDSDARSRRPVGYQPATTRRRCVGSGKPSLRILSRMHKQRMPSSVDGVIHLRLDFLVCPFDTGPPFDAYNADKTRRRDTTTCDQE